MFIASPFYCSVLLSQVWASSSDDTLALEKKGQQKVVLSTDALPCAINDEGLRQFRVKRCATRCPTRQVCRGGGGRNGVVHCAQQGFTFLDLCLRAQGPCPSNPPRAMRHVKPTAPVDIHEPWVPASGH